MKKGVLLNSDVSHLIASMGHGDEMTIADAGLPIPDEVERIDLALTHGVPSFEDTVRTVLSELQVEAVFIAHEIKEHNPSAHQILEGLLDDAERDQGADISRHYVSHEEFKDISCDSLAVVRTGECSPYANVIFQSGVVF